MISSDVMSGAEVIRWEPPVLSRNRGELPATGTHPESLADGDNQLTVEDWKKRVELAKDTGYQAGLIEGKTYADNRNTSEKDQLLQVLHHLKNPLKKVDDKVMQEVVNLALSLAKVVVRREMVLDNAYYLELLNGVFAETVDVAELVSIRLNPKDLDLLINHKCDRFSGEDLKLVADLSLPRGSCQIETRTSYLDLGVDSLLESAARSIDLDSDC